MIKLNRSGWKKSEISWAFAGAFMLVGAPPIASAGDNIDKYDFKHVSCRGADNEIKLIISGVKDSVGLMRADLYPNNEEGFLKSSGRIKQVSFAARMPATQFCITAPDTGVFAIAVYHDRNANAEFDKTGIGLPNEPWGLSNNPKVRFSAPPVTKVLFDVTDKGAKLEIKLR